VKLGLGLKRGWAWLLGLISGGDSPEKISPSWKEIFSDD